MSAKLESTSSMLEFGFLVHKMEFQDGGIQNTIAMVAPTIRSVRRLTLLPKRGFWASKTVEEAAGPKNGPRFAAANGTPLRPRREVSRRALRSSGQAAQAERGRWGLGGEGEPTRWDRDKRWWEAK